MNRKNFVDLNAKIYIAGHRGLAGSAIFRRLTADGYKNIITKTHTDLDLTNQTAVERFFAAEKPEYVFLAAAKVGGIYANNTYPAEFIFQNSAIQTHVIHEAWKTGVKRLLFLGSSCIYPRDCPQPMKEEYLLTGLPEPTNRPYAVAKIAGIEMCWAYNRQYQTKYIAAMPTNLFGSGDNFDAQTSHVLAALIRRMCEAQVRNEREAVVWGTGNPRREFLYSDDLAAACVLLMNLPEDQYATLLSPDMPPLINIGCGKDITIRELAELVAETAGFKGKLVFDKTKPDGTNQKLLDVSKINRLGWHSKISLREGIAKAYAEFKETFHADTHGKTGAIK
jgi:GDP-L-fucose synthase